MDLYRETLQAVSMLQPFRHPKPGLTIMKAEELKQEFIRNLRRHIPQPLMSFFIQGLDEYVQQVSIQFANHLSDIVTNGDDLFSFEEEYINWIKNQ